MTEEFRDIARDYTSFYAISGEVSVITGDGAKKFAEAIKEESVIEQEIMFLNIDPDETALSANDEKASRAVVHTLTRLAEQNGIGIVVVIDKKQEHIQGSLGALMERKVTNITQCNKRENGKYHIIDTKIRDRVRPVDEEVEG